MNFVFSFFLNVIRQAPSSKGALSRKHKKESQRQLKTAGAGSYNTGRDNTNRVRSEGAKIPR